MKLIGITSSSTENRSFLNRAYTNAFMREGVVPIILPQFPITNRETLTQEEYNEIHADRIEGLIDGISALVVSGGPDLNATTFDQPNWGANSCDSERDMMELALIDAAILAGKPIMGICRGHQAILMHRFIPMARPAMGEEPCMTFLQDLAETLELHNGGDREFKDRQEPVHQVFVMQGAFRDYLRAKTGRPDLASLNVTSLHHQGVCFSPDGKRPKIKRAQYPQWMANKIREIEDKTTLKVLTCTGMVIEGTEHVGFKMVTFQGHVEEHGPKGLAMQYWIDSYVL